MKMSISTAVPDICVLIVLVLGGYGSTIARAQSSMRFSEQDGEALFKGICQGCHMANGAGAVGAGAYPPLTRDPNLSGRGYPVVIVVNGRKAMPAFGDLLSDKQIAAVVNYIRSHFGNHYTDEVTMSEVKAMRPQAPQTLHPTKDPFRPTQGEN